MNNCIYETISNNNDKNYKQYTNNSIINEQWPDIGYLRLRTFTATNAIPVANVEVNIKAIVDDVKIFEQTVFTDEFGLYPDIELACPPKELSLQENNTTQIPYARYIITAVAEGFQALIIANSQIFSGEITLGELSLTPERDGTPKGQPIIIDVPQHTLWDNKSSSGVAPAIESRVLSEVFIPDKIIIHLGTPTSNAANVTVNFRDYIKNVASCEIYPTWPTEALRANIHAQISIAINRIYTEWYISRGYSFHITNSPSYDQAYVSGREIFNSVSVITDEIFNTYLRKSGTINPFYAAYCDGKLVSCSGMKQWGSVTLAQNGKNALQILQNYYGSSIEIVRSSNIKGISQSYPGTPVKMGDRGTNVSILQRQLNRITQDYPFFGTLTVDGVFGSTMQTTVKRFQSQFSLTSDGIVGRSTWYKISYVYVSVTKLAQLTSEGEKPKGELIVGGYGGTPLKVGSTGTQVETMQNWLSTISRFDTRVPNVSVDGIFGNGTKAAVIAFQKAYGLTADGIVGNSTWNTLYTEYESINSDIGTGNGSFDGTTLEQGSQGENVRMVQFWLRIIARSNSKIPVISIDGVYGDGTKTAVERFQSAYGLNSDGKVGRITWNKLYEVYTDLQNGLISGSQIPGTYPNQVLQRGSSGARVKEVQYYLYILSAYYPQIPLISFDGVFGTATEQAVREYQQLFSLTVDGKVGANTWASIYNRFVNLTNFSGKVKASFVIEYPGYELRIGQTDVLVQFLQYMLAYVSVYIPDILQYPSFDDEEFDGIYTEYLAEIVMAFQKEFNLPQSGVVDEQTWNTLLEEFLTVSAQNEYAQEFKGVYPNYVMLLGSSGASVLELQKYINGIAQRYEISSFVPENGIFALQTYNAVKAIQQGFNLPITGTVTRDVWEMIYNFYLLED